MIHRRGFIRHAGFSVGAATGMWATLATADTVDRRSVSFVHTHTCEKLTAAYGQDGEYQPEVLQQVNHVLRDFRTNEVHAIDPALLGVLFALRTTVNS